MNPSAQASALLTSAQRSWVVGTRPSKSRKAAHWLASAMRQGMLGLVMVGALGLPAQAAGSRTDMDSPVVVPDRNAAVAMIEPVVVETALSRRSASLKWVLPTGQIDGSQLLSMWREGGVTPTQATQLLNVLVWTQSPVIAQTAEVRDRTRLQSEHTAGILDVRTGEQARDFLTQHNTDVLAWQGILHSSEALNGLNGEGFTWTDVEVYWQRLSSDRADEANSEPRVTGWGIQPDRQNMAAARKALIAAVRESGLAGLRVPLPTWNDSANVMTVAKRVQESNAVLQELTGWEGPVLGLNGRVEWTANSPLALGVTFYRGPQETVLLSGWEELPHEWFHALDYALRTTPVDLSTNGGATFTQQWSANSPPHSLESSWGTLHDRLRSFSIKHGGTWYTDRDSRVARLKASSNGDDQWRANYLQHKHETVAFAWQAYVQTHLNADSASWTEQATNGQMGPKVAEAQASAPLWQALFADIGEQWWAGQRRTVHQWRQGRALAEGQALVKTAVRSPAP